MYARARTCVHVCMCAGGQAGRQVGRQAGRQVGRQVGVSLTRVCRLCIGVCIGEFGHFETFHRPPIWAVNRSRLGFFEGVKVSSSKYINYCLKRKFDALTAICSL